MEEFPSLLQGFAEFIDFIKRVIKVKTRPGSGRYAKTLVQGHGAMMAGSDGNALAVEELGHVVGMDPLKNKTDQPAFVLRLQGR